MYQILRDSVRKIATGDKNDDIIGPVSRDFAKFILQQINKLTSDEPKKS